MQLRTREMRWSYQSAHLHREGKKIWLRVQQICASAPTPGDGIDTNFLTENGVMAGLSRNKSKEFFLVGFHPVIFTPLESSKFPSKSVLNRTLRTHTQKEEVDCSNFCCISRQQFLWMRLKSHDNKFGNLFKLFWYNYGNFMTLLWLWLTSGV